MRWIPWAVAAGAGAVVMAVSTAAARHPTISARETRIFRAVNRLPGWLYWILWLPMQLGNLVVGALAGLAVALWARRIALALAVVAATALKLVAERVIRKRMAGWLAVRQRPGTSQPGAILRGADVPAAGPSFPSGHVILAWGVACVTSTALPWPAAVGALALAALVGFGRMYVGAHNPLDVTAGLGAGVLLGAALAVVLVH